MAQMVDKIKSLGVSIQKSAMPHEEPTIPQQLLRQVDDAVTLTFKQRMIGFGVCMALGVLLSALSLIFVWTLQLTKFAILYSIGSVLSICSTMFLTGPAKQCKRMLDSGRIIATSVYLGSIVATLVVAFKVGNAGLVLVCLIIQFLALIWYCVTWIPGGQGLLKGMLGLS